MSPVAAIDIGTNSVRLLVLDAQGNELARLMEITRLGQGVDATGRLHPDAIARTAAVLERYASTMREHGVERVRATATSAARDAANRDEFFGVVNSLIGHPPELLSGDDEARLSFFGATSDLDPALGPFVVFDIGGGSTEFARGGSQPERHISVNMGGVRITERFLHSDPPSKTEIEAARAHVRSLLEQVRAALALGSADGASSKDAPRTWLGLAGTVTTFASSAAGLTTYDASVTHGYVLSREQVNNFSETLLRHTTEQRKSLILEPKRAAVVIGGAIVLSEVMREFDLTEVRTSERDILDGLAASLRAPI
jgi:exopolyphosphatase/guanosine-5'-triphosphate,3'-diphosphate pyrophosphatase